MQFGFDLLSRSPLDPKVRMVENEDNLALTPIGDFAQFFSSYVFPTSPLYNTFRFGVERYNPIPVSGSRNR